MEINVEYKDKYLKYKEKYLNLQNQLEQNGENTSCGVGADTKTRIQDNLKQIEPVVELSDGGFKPSIVSL